MGFDAQAKRFFILIVGALVALAAYFQASGIGELVGAAIDQGPATKAASHVAQLPATPRPEPKTAGPILARNAFDSVTGPLTGVKESEVASNPTPIKNGNDPYQDPPCNGVKASLITASDDPDWSFANLTGSDGKSQLRRKGDIVGSAQVVHIGWYPNAPEPAPHVWMNEGGSRCLVGNGTIEAPKKSALSKDSDKDKDSAEPKKKGNVPPEIGDKIHKISDTQFEVERSAVPQIIQNYAQLAAGLRTRTTKDGVRLSGIKGNSILNTLGMKNGDVLKAINGFDMSDQDKALEAYAKLKTASHLSITVERGGSPSTIDIGIK